MPLSVRKVTIAYRRTNIRIAPFRVRLAELMFRCHGRFLSYADLKRKLLAAKENDLVKRARYVPFGLVNIGVKLRKSLALGHG